MRPILLFLLSSISICQSNSQSTFPTSSEFQQWEFVEWSFFGGNCRYHLFQNGQDVNVCDENFVELYDCQQWNVNGQNIDTCILTSYYRIENSKITVRKHGYWQNGIRIDSANCSEPEILFYDFDATIGDSIIGFHNNQETEYIVKSNFIQNYVGVDRKTLELEYIPFSSNPNFADQTTWIDGIGSTEHPLYPFECLNHNCDVEYKLTKVIRDNNLIYLDTTFQFSFDDCNSFSNEPFLSNTSEVLYKPKFRLFPNPAINQIRISNGVSQNKIKVSIYDISGIKIYNNATYIPNSKINLGGIRQVIYIVKIVDSPTQVSLKFVVE